MGRPSAAEVAVLLREQRRLVELGVAAREDERLFVHRLRASLLTRLGADFDTANRATDDEPAARAEAEPGPRVPQRPSDRRRQAAGLARLDSQAGQG